MSIARKSAFDGIIQLSTVVISFASGVVLSRALGAEGRGVYVLPTLVVSGLISNFGSLGLASACQTYVSKASERLGELHSASIIFVGIVSTIVVGIFLLAESSLQRVGLGGLEPIHIAIIAAGTPALLYQAIWKGLMNGLGAIQKRAIHDLVFTVLQSTSIVTVILVLETPVVPLIIAYYGVYLVLIPYMLYSLSKNGALIQPVKRSTFRDLIGFGKWVYIGNMAARFRLQVDQIIVRSAGGEGALGVYNQAHTLASRGLLLPAALSTAAFRSIATVDRPEAGRLTAAAFRQVLILGTVASIAGYFIAYLIPFIYGEDFRPAIWIFQLLVPAFFCVGAARVFAVFFTGHLAKPQVPLVINWVLIFIQLGLSYWLLQTMEPLPAIATASAVSLVLVGLAFMTVFLCWPGTPSPKELFAFQRQDFESWKKLLPSRKKVSPS